MDLTPERKAHIDSLTIYDLLRRWRFARIGDEMMQGETGNYWKERMKELRGQPGGQEQWVAASKQIGW